MFGIFSRRSKVTDKPKQSSFLDDDIDPTKLWRNYKDEDAEWEHLLNIIGEESDKDEHRVSIEVEKKYGLKHIAVRVGELPRTVQGAISRQRFRRKTGMNMPVKRDFIPQKRRLDSLRVH
jgi:hypothetical protein